MPTDRFANEIPVYGSVSVQTGAYSEGYKQGQEDLLNEMMADVTWDDWNRKKLELVAAIKGITLKETTND